MEQFPTTRLRRLRTTSQIRDLVAEHQLSINDLIWPLFVIEGSNIQEPISSMPRVFRNSIDILVEEAKRAADLGINAIALFPVTPITLKTPCGKEAYNHENIVSKAIRAIKKHVPNISIICDVALDPYTSHGHDGVVVNDYVDNDITLDALVKQTLTCANAGCNFIAPSDMMDGRVGVLRKALDDAGYINVGIISYAAKYASGCYGPFREAVASSGSLGKASKSTYQMDPRNKREALREVMLDIAEGADIVMVKPGIMYLDVIARLRDRYDIPIFVYQVSGEYSMLVAASQNGWLDYERMMLESLIAFKRAGASAIFTYAAIEMALCLKN